MEALFDVCVFHTDVNISSDKVLANSEREIKHLEPSEVRHAPFTPLATEGMLGMKF